VKPLDASAVPGTPPHKHTLVRKMLPSLIGAVLLGSAILVGMRELETLPSGEIAEALAHWGAIPILGAVALTALSYLLLAVNEGMGLRWAGARVPWYQVVRASFVANAFAHSLGFHLLTGGAARMRIYGRGVSLLAVARTTLYCALAFGCGIALLGGLAVLAAPAASLAMLPMPPFALRIAGFLFATLSLLYLGAAATLKGGLSIRGRYISVPGPGYAAAQILVGAADNLVTGLLVYILLPPGAVDLPAFIAAYAAATALGLVSALPGGVGVFEASMLLLLPDTGRLPLLAALFGYRLFYYLLPLALAAALLLRQEFAAYFARMRRAVTAAAPLLSALLVFASAAFLIVTAAAPIGHKRLQLLRTLTPLVVVETAHLASLLSGLALLALARGLSHRLSAARLWALAALAVAIPSALARGLDYGPAALLLGCALVLVVTGDAFYRPSRLARDRFKPGWDVAMLAVLGGSVALGFWEYHHIPYRSGLWTAIGYHGDPSRFLRGSAVLAAAIVVAGIWRLARAAAPAVELASPAVLQRIRPLVEASPDTGSRLALLGDKQILLSPEGGAFLMYRARGASWIVMGDPVGDLLQGRALLWRLKELADAAGGRLVLYQVRADRLGDYVDLGLAFIKLGEEARVNLTSFALAGAARRNLRHSYGHAIREGLSFSLRSPPLDDQTLDALEQLSNGWLRSRGMSEKGFSLGWFDRAQVRGSSVALVHHRGSIVAFADVWLGGNTEASVNLMRHAAGAPRGAMDFLFVNLMLWAKDRGYVWFNLGMATLSGLEEHRLAPVWHKLARGFARRASRLYDFAGLRQFKEKFSPDWSARYLAAPPTHIPAALLDVTRLISSGPPVRRRPRHGRLVGAAMQLRGFRHAVTAPGLRLALVAAASSLGLLLAAFPPTAAGRAVTVDTAEPRAAALPLHLYPASGSDLHTLAVFYSGDGGWARIDRTLAGALARRGVPVIGWNSLRYFWHRRDPDRAAADLAAVLRRYLVEWRKTDVVLLGFSLGASPLPLIVERLPASLRAKIRLLVLIGPDENAAFEFHAREWLGWRARHEIPVAPALAALTDIPKICIYGTGESRPACARFASGLVTPIGLPGGHHFNGDYDAIARVIWAQIAPRA
jgi:phosphatidylglycerol lysyltransferase